ncbi:MAG TPA: thioredoxin family protein [Candidatus Paceibacterota bacterium]|nr:thioredoxin family protein [Candidatus Paceibacterota bacterium]
MIEATERTIEKLISTGKVLVEIYTPTCVPCQQMKNNALAEIETEAKVVLVDATKNMGAVSWLSKQGIGNVSGVPVLLYFKDGELKNRAGFIGTKEGVLSFIGK